MCAAVNWAAQCMTGSSFEVVGNSSRGGEVPQSDLDLTVLIRHGAAEGEAAAGPPRSLQQRLEEQAGIDGAVVKTKLVDSRVPVLRLTDWTGSIARRVRGSATRFEARTEPEGGH